MRTSFATSISTTEDDEEEDDEILEQPPLRLFVNEQTTFEKADDDCPICVELYADRVSILFECSLEQTGVP